MTTTTKTALACVLRKGSVMRMIDVLKEHGITCKYNTKKDRFVAEFGDDLRSNGGLTIAFKDGRYLVDLCIEVCTPTHPEMVHIPVVSGKISADDRIQLKTELLRVMGQLVNLKEKGEKLGDEVRKFEDAKHELRSIANRLKGTKAMEVLGLTKTEAIKRARFPMAAWL